MTSRHAEETHPSCQAATFRYSANDPAGSRTGTDHHTPLARPQQLNTHEPPKMPGLDCQERMGFSLIPPTEPTMVG